ncbi:hypothetical protein Ahy_B03g067599 [Arachis hypogaea]|uniref:Aminotransferase-like plant mobile domain-containing protein n=1 Tax=Arachis hypogaea TaxID=3818 RepID=A0A445A785_ARAHY|nr:hypothetical protein Ahy_B03g067599 [Arachis hypogaea]
MTYTANNDGDINKLNETLHYAGAVDFARSRLLLSRRVSHTLPPPDAIVPTVSTRYPPTDDPETLRQYARCYIMLLIGGYMMTGQVEQLGPPALCRALSWGSAVLAWTYQSLCSAAHQGVTIAIDVLDIPEISSVVSTGASWLDYSSRAEISMRLGFCDGEYRLTSYNSMSYITVLSVCMEVFHQVDRVRQQFNGEQLLTSTGQGEDVWWLDRHHDWHNRWRSHFDPSHRISILHTFDSRPTQDIITIGGMGLAV